MNLKYLKEYLAWWKAHVITAKTRTLKIKFTILVTASHCVFLLTHSLFIVFNWRSWLVGLPKFLGTSRSLCSYSSFIAWSAFLIKVFLHQLSTSPLKTWTIWALYPVFPILVMGGRLTLILIPYFCFFTRIPSVLLPTSSTSCPLPAFWKVLGHRPQTIAQSHLMLLPISSQCGLRRGRWQGEWDNWAEDLKSGDEGGGHWCLVSTDFFCTRTPPPLFII